MLTTVIEKATFDQLSPELQAEYKVMGGSDGMYLLDTKAVSHGGKLWSLEDVHCLKSALAKERTRADAASTSLKYFDGLDVQAARAALEQIEKINAGDPSEEAKTQIATFKKQLEDKHAGELEARDKTMGGLTTQIEKLLVESVASQAIATEHGASLLLLPHVKNSTRVVQDSTTGEFRVEVIDADGTPRISTASGNTGNMTIAELVSEMKGADQFAPAFAGTGATGSGAAGSGQSGSKQGKYVLSDEDARDPAKYRAAKAAAEEAGQDLVRESA